jgi:L-gulonate 3-dehydrogenase
MRNSAPNREPTRVAVVGAGLVGSSWAVVFARAGCTVVVHDQDPKQLQAAQTGIRQTLLSLEASGALPGTAAAILERIAYEPERANAVLHADYVQESIIESIEAKRGLFQCLDREAPAAAVLASSTSSFPISAIAADLSGRSRCIVAHPANPPHLISLTEVCGAEFTSADTIQRTLALLENVGQAPVLLRQEIDGFVLNRLQWSLLAEALRLVEDGVISAADVDRVVSLGLARRWALMGPLHVGDLNAPGGLSDYLARFGPTVNRIAESRGASPVALTEPLPAALRELQDQAAREPRATRLQQRDENLLQLNKVLDPMLEATRRRS